MSAGNEVKLLSLKSRDSKETRSLKSPGESDAIDLLLKSNPVMFARCVVVTSLGELTSEIALTIAVRTAAERDSTAGSATFITFTVTLIEAERLPSEAVTTTEYEAFVSTSSALLFVSCPVVLPIVNDAASVPLSE